MEQETYKVRWSIDRITVVGDLRRMPVVFQPEFENQSGWTKNPYRTGLVFDLVQTLADDKKVNIAHFEEVPYPLKGMDRPVRLEFNPNHLSDEAVKQVLKVMWSITKTHLSRIDIACDVLGLSLEYFKNGGVRTNRDTRRGINGHVQTEYYGSRQSDQYVRVYNKRIERDEHGFEQEEENADIWWRLEFEFKHGGVEEFDERIEKFLSSFHILNYYDESVSPIDRAVLFAREYGVVNFDEFSKHYAAKLRKMTRENQGYNASFAEFAYKVYQEQRPQLQEQIDALVQKYDLKKNIDVYMREAEEQIKKYGRISTPWSLGEHDDTMWRALEKLEQIEAKRNS